MRKCANIKSYMRTRGGRKSIMTLQLIPSDFLIYEENLIFFLSVYSTATDMIIVYRFNSTSLVKF